MELGCDPGLLSPPISDSYDCCSSCLSFQDGGKVGKSRSKQTASPWQPESAGVSRSCSGVLPCFTQAAFHWLWDTVHSVKARTRASAALGRKAWCQQEQLLGRLLGSVKL